VRVFGIDPGSQRTGFGCVESDGRRHHLVMCGAIRVATGAAFPARLSSIFRELSAHIHDSRAVVGYGRAEKPQVQQMIKLLLGLDRVPSPHDAADALAVAICHLHSGKGLLGGGARLQPGHNRSTTWRTYKPTRPA
jgi:crossover junction endodeoxyribonuclease RuvC